MYDIAIADQQEALAVDEAYLIEVGQRTLAEEQVAAAQISIVLVDNPTIHELNRQYLDHDEPTDVLSFLLDCESGEAAEPEVNAAMGAGKQIDGEIIISAEMAAQRAPEFGWSPTDELVLYLVHGLLHLTGYDDLEPEAQQNMRRREREILALWNLSPRHSTGTSPGAPEERIRD